MIFCRNIIARSGALKPFSVWGYKVSLLGEAVHKDHDGTEFAGGGELDYGIHG